MFWEHFILLRATPILALTLLAIITLVIQVEQFTLHLLMTFKRLEQEVGELALVSFFSVFSKKFY